MATTLQFIRVDKETDTSGGGWGRYVGDVPEVGDILEFHQDPNSWAGKRFKVVRKEFHFVPNPRYDPAEFGVEKASQELFTIGNWFIQECVIFMIEFQG